MKVRHWKVFKRIRGGADYVPNHPGSADMPVVDADSEAEAHRRAVEYFAAEPDKRVQFVRIQYHYQSRS